MSEKYKFRDAEGTYFTTTTIVGRNLLGFNLIHYFLDPPVYAMVERDGLQIHFGKGDTDSIKANDQFRKIGCDLIIWTPEMDEFCDEVKSKGANIVEGIVKRVCGGREFVFWDCVGHKILVCD